MLWAGGSCCCCCWAFTACFEHEHTLSKLTNPTPNYELVQELVGSTPSSSGTQLCAKSGYLSVKQPTCTCNKQSVSDQSAFHSQLTMRWRALRWCSQTSSSKTCRHQRSSSSQPSFGLLQPCQRPCLRLAQHPSSRSLGCQDRPPSWCCRRG